MKFKKGAEPMYTSDFWYDATMGGYIKPEKFLENEEDFIAYCYLGTRSTWTGVPRRTDNSG